jgi:hypothetical protein
MGKLILEELERLLDGKTYEELDELLGVFKEEHLERLAKKLAVVKRYLKRRIALERYERYMREGDFEQAAYVAYRLDKGRVRKAAIKAYEKYIKEDNLHRALVISTRHDIGM